MVYKDLEIYCIKDNIIDILLGIVICILFVLFFIILYVCCRKKSKIFNYFMVMYGWLLFFLKFKKRLFKFIINIEYFDYIIIMDKD